MWPGHGHPLPDAESQGCRGCSGSPWCLGPARLGKTPTWSTSVSGGFHSVSLQGEWVYSALSYQFVLSSSCHIVAGSSFSIGEQKQDRIWDTTTVTRSPECQAGGLVRQGCWKKLHLQAASGEHPTGHPRPPLPLDHLRCWDAIDCAGEGLGAPPGVDARGRGFLLMDAWRNCKGQSDTVSGCRLICCIPRPDTTLLRLIYRVWALKHHRSQGTSWEAQTCKAEQVILRQI